MTMDPTTNSVEYQSVRASGRRYLTDDIADTAHCLQQLFFERPIDAIAQATHEDVDDISLRVEVVLPHVRKDHRLRDHFARVPHQVLEQGKFARAKLDRVTAPRHLARQ